MTFKILNDLYSFNLSSVLFSNLFHFPSEYLLSFAEFSYEFVLGYFFYFFFLFFPPFPTRLFLSEFINIVSAYGDGKGSLTFNMYLNFDEGGVCD